MEFKFSKNLLLILIFIPVSLTIAQESNLTSKVEIRRLITSGCLNWSCPLIEGSEYPEDCKALVCDYGGCSYLEFSNETLRKIVESYYDESVRRCIKISVVGDFKIENEKPTVYVTMMKIENKSYGVPPRLPSCISKEEAERIAIKAGVKQPFSCYPRYRVVKGIWVVNKWIVRKFEKEIKGGCGRYGDMRIAKEIHISCDGNVVDIKENLTFCCINNECRRFLEKFLNKSEEEKACISEKEAEEIARKEGFPPPYKFFELVTKITTGEKSWHVKKIFEGNAICPKGFEGFLEIDCKGSVIKKEIKSLCEETKQEEFVNCTKEIAIEKANEFLIRLVGKDYFINHFKLKEIRLTNPVPGIVKYQVIYDVVFQIGNESYALPTRVKVVGALGTPASKLKETFSTTGVIKYIPIEGGFYGIVSDEREKYLPLNLPDEFKKEGLRVWFTAKPKKEIGTIYQWGLPIEILEIKKIEWSFNSSSELYETMRTCKVNEVDGISLPIDPFIDKETAIKIVKESGFEPKSSEEFPHEFKLRLLREIKLDGVKVYSKEPRWFIYIGKQKHTIRVPCYNNTWREVEFKLPSAAVVNPMTGEIEDVVPLTQPLSISITTMEEGVEIVEKPQPKRKVRLVNERARRIISKLRIKRVKLEKSEGKLCLSLQARKTVRLLGIIPISVPLKVEITSEAFRLEKPLWVKVIELFSVG